MTVIITDPRVLSRKMEEEQERGKSIGLVPTMGYLHEGHLSLVQQCRKENDCTVVSIFVNPTQFGPSEDLQSYPRNLQGDVALLEKERVDLVFAPEPEEMYGKDFSVFVEEESLSKNLCGASRPGHFRGVCTVVLKLFNIARPHRAYFGQKDYQQLKVIQRMVRDLNVPVEVRSCPIVRDPDGLAKSSRNSYLSEEERGEALLLSFSLKAAQKALEGGENRASALRDMILKRFEKSSLAKPEYVAILHPETLKPLETIEETALLALAVRVGKTRLIDNCLLQPPR
jgi:pantoate--beta-alanine ligase